MNSNKWSYLKSTRNGAIVGLLYSLYTTYTDGLLSGLSGDIMLSYIGGYVFGGAVGGAFLFCIVAFIRNLFVK